MKTNFILAGLAGGIVNFFLGWLIYGVLLTGFMQNNVIHYDGLMNEMPTMYLLIISNLVAGFFLAFIFDRWAKISTLKGGFKGGLIIGLFISFMMDLSFSASMNLYNAKATIVDIIAFTILFAFMGASVGWVLGYKKAE
jgi:hypothetical protein